jgi:hypothetical protein
LTQFTGSPLRVALLASGLANGVLPRERMDELAASLGDLGLDGTVIGHRNLPARILRARGFAESLAGIPTSVIALMRGEFDLAHAFSPADAVAAQAWAKLGGGPLVLTFVESPAREHLADARGRLWMLRTAMASAAAVTATDESKRRAVQRWLATDVPLLDLADVNGHADLYGEVLALAGSPSGSDPGGPK